jgi:predicted alpha-1,2-mannosidase
MIKKAICALLSVVAIGLNAQNNYTQYVNPFVGTDGHGHTFPGATTPYAMVQLSPDTRIDGSWDGCSGYHYSDSIIYGFSHTHLSGTGCSDYGDIAFMPTFVNKAIEPIWSLDKLSYSFSHKNEKASPGYYSVKLNNGILVELTSTARVGLQKYTYFQNGYAWITLDLKHRDILLEGKITQIDKHTFSGLRRSEAWAVDQLLYYYFQVSRDADQIHITKDSNGQTKINLGFQVKKGESIMLKTALSTVDEKGAQNNLEKELNHWDFKKVKAEANKAWNLELNRIKVYGGSLVEKKNFYTALYHCMMHPNVLNDVDGRYMGRDKKVHVADGFNYYSVFSLWDTYRALHPLLNMIDKNRSHDFIMTFKAQYEQSRRLPMWELWGNETNCMIGFHSVSVIWNAYINNVITKQELADIYPAVYAEAMNNRSGLDKFRAKGFLSIEDESESVSKTLEYAFNMHCVARMAYRLGKLEDGQKFEQYSQAWKHLKDVNTGFMVPRSNGGWIKDYDPTQVNNHFTEANAWQYTFAVQHENGAVFGNYNLLSKLFNTSSKTTGREQADITGLIGQYAHGNEPSHHVTYLFNDIDSTQKYVKRICDEFYHPTPNGLIGNEDCGQMSAWYVFSAMGFYPADPSTKTLIFGNMLFDSVRFVQDDGSAVIHKNLTKSSVLNNRPFVRSNDCILGEEVYYWGYDFPRDVAIGTEQNCLISAPVIHSNAEVFKGTQKITITSNNSYTNSSFDSKFYYTLDGSDPDKNAKEYIKGDTLIISQSCLLKVIEIDARGCVSKPAVARFYQYYNDYSIQYNCTYNKQYTAGGDKGLIDGLIGDVDWRKGRWQGYQSQDFEVVIDLKKPMLFDTIKIGFLQDKRSWIFLPDWISVYGSEDSVHFEELNTGDYMLDERDLTVGRYPIVFSGFKKSTPYRYLKVFVKNYGKLPAWHPGAGGDAFIFVDEIEVK